MTVSDLKVDILKYVAETDDRPFLQSVLAFIQSHTKEKDWWDDLTDSEIASIESGEQQLDAGKGISHEEVKGKARQIIFQN